MIFLVALDYGSKVFAQTYLSISYQPHLISFETNIDRVIILSIVFFCFLFFQLSSDLFSKLNELCNWGQNLFVAFIFSSVLDCYLYPGALKWIWFFSFSDLYLFIAGVFTIILFYNYYKKLTGKV